MPFNKVSAVVVVVVVVVVVLVLVVVVVVLVLVLVLVVVVTAVLLVVVSAVWWSVQFISPCCTQCVPSSRAKVMSSCSTCSVL